MQKTDLEIEKIVKFFLPHLMVAGDYALSIQQHINSLPDKSDADLAKAALTDADVSIQNYFEVLTLAAFPCAGFLGEEEKSSINKKYFLPNKEFSIVLDPINGTLRYKNGDMFEIILTVLDGHGVIKAAMLYVPKIAICYVGIAGRGAFVVGGGNEMQDINLCVPKSFANTILVLRVGQLEEKLKPEFLIFDEHRDYVPNKYVHAPYEIFTGAINGFIVNQPHCEDSLPLAFIADSAGFIVTDLDGEKMNFSFNSLADIKPSVLIADTPETHKKIIQAARNEDEIAKPVIAGEFIDTAQHAGGDTAKVNAWSKWTLKHLKEMRMAKKGGLLGKDAADWRNVAEHLLVVNALSMYVGKHVADAGHELDAKALDQGSVLHNFFPKGRKKKAGLATPTNTKPQSNGIYLRRRDTMKIS